MAATSIVTDNANEKRDITGTELDWRFGILRAFRSTAALVLYSPDLIQVPSLCL